MPGEHGDGERHLALRRRKGQLLTDRGRPYRLFPPQTLCYLPVDMSNNCIFALKFGLKEAFLYLDKTCPLKVSQRCLLRSDHGWKLHVSDSFFNDME